MMYQKHYRLPPTADEVTMRQRAALDSIQWLKSGGARDWTHCIHGTFVGDWAGPDYMCGYCEDGMTIYEAAIMTGHEAVHRHREWSQREVFERLCTSMRDKVMSPEAFLHLAPYLMPA